MTGKDPFVEYLEVVHTDWHSMTKAQQRALKIALVEQRMEEMVARGELRRAGIDDQGRQTYELSRTKH